jgi:DNA-binding FadR family transcriptional regulator
VAEAIRARIATGALRPGDMLPSERSLLDEFGVARPTMREALRILESDGLVSVRRGVNGGAQVQDHDIATLARRAGLYLQAHDVHLGDLMAAVRIIQPGVVALAAASATPAQIHDLRAQIARVAEAEGPRAFTDQATAFLGALMQASGNSTLAFISSMLDRLVRVEARAYVDEHATDHEPGAQDEFQAWCIDQYTHLVDLIEGGEGAAAEEFWREHLRVVPPQLDGDPPLTIYEAGGVDHRPGDPCQQGLHHHPLIGYH